MRFLTPALGAIEDALLKMRAEVDLSLASAGPVYGKPYPYGFCLEITEAVMVHIRALLTRPSRSPGERALSAFLKHRGQISIIWGVLRGRYFQNAFRIGGLYVDVSNDTVDVRKPKVEILPLDQSGFETIRDGAHYAEIAARYWGQSCFANTALPSLAPLYPIIAIDQTGQIQLQSDVGYMLRMFRANGFERSEAWLRAAPPPPRGALLGLRQVAPPDLLAQNPISGLDASLAACARLRTLTQPHDLAWIESMRAQFKSLPVFQVLNTMD